MATAQQTAGPYWHMIDFPEWADATRFGAEGPRITLTGVIRDGAAAPVTDAMVEIWHADPAGRYDAEFQGFGRCRTDAEGRFRFTTLKPGPVPGRGNAMQAPHVLLAIFARGLMRHLLTRLYFAGEALNETDPLLALVPEARRPTLIARESEPGVWTLDIRLQGEGETVLLDV
jgi:protocatechuate 3,4-dioxygenase alpha subunit